MTLVRYGATPGGKPAGTFRIPDGFANVPIGAGTALRVRQADGSTLTYNVTAIVTIEVEEVVPGEFGAFAIDLACTD